MSNSKRHGAEVIDGGVVFRWWSPDRQKAEVVVWKDQNGTLEDRVVPLLTGTQGWFEALDPLGKPGDCYQIRVNGEELVPDIASRSQPKGVYGPSQVVAGQRYEWKAKAWRRPEIKDLVIYELHVGTWTETGTFEGAKSKLKYLHALGVNAIELMPLGAFPGNRNWGYDPVFFFALPVAYGTPDQLRSFVDAAHQLGMAVIIDVVYNHVCGEPNWLKKTSPFYFKTGGNAWGEALNFDAKNAEGMRSLVLQNVAHWFEEYHVDGLRLDATHAIADSTTPHILQEIAETAHRYDGVVIAEDDRNEVNLLRSPQDGGLGMDAAWADDFHHSLKVKITDERIGYFDSYKGDAAELAETLQHGWLFRGQIFPHTQQPRGTPCSAQPPMQFVHCISNHDQVGNRPLGERLNQLTTPEAYRAASMLLCLTPFTPMLFMGQEWATGSPFFFFTDHGNDLGKNIREGRLKEFSSARNFWPPDSLKCMPHPEDPTTFLRSKLNWNGRNSEAGLKMVELYRACLEIRHRSDFWRKGDRRAFTVQTQQGALLIHLGSDGATPLLLLVTFGPLVKPLQLPAKNWEIVISSNESRFGGPKETPVISSAGLCEFDRVEAVLFRPS